MTIDELPKEEVRGRSHSISIHDRTVQCARMNLAGLGHGCTPSLLRLPLAPMTHDLHPSRPQPPNDDPCPHLGSTPLLLPQHKKQAFRFEVLKALEAFTPSLDAEQLEAYTCIMALSAGRKPTNMQVRGQCGVAVGQYSSAHRAGSCYGHRLLGLPCPLPAGLASPFKEQLGALVLAGPVAWSMAP